MLSFGEHGDQTPLATYPKNPETSDGFDYITEPVGPTQMQQLTVEDVVKALPANMKSAATQELTDKLNNIVNDPLAGEHIRENFVNYIGVLKDGRFKTEDYLNAVTYVSFKIMGMSNQQAYEHTFPDRMNKLIAAGATKKDISAYVSIYNKGKLVNLIYEQTMIPTWVLNQDAFQKAINTQVELMTTSSSDLVRTQAANSVLTHLKKPEVKEFQISMETKENSGMKELMGTLEQLALQQQKMISSGVPTREIAAQPLLHEKVEEADFVEVGESGNNAAD